MSAPRFGIENNAAIALNPTRPTSRHIKWMSLPKTNIQSIRDLAAKAASSPESRFFALVSRPQPPRSGAISIRRVLVIDNHPATLRLLSAAPVDAPEVSVPISNKRLALYLALAALLIALAVTAMVWPLFPR
jgi:hypothetical protein